MAENAEIKVSGADVVVTSGATEVVSEVEKSAIHPITQKEAACRAAAVEIDDTVSCINASARAWNSEVDRYYSLLHKRLIGESKQNIYESQRYWLLNKNFDVKVINSLNEFDTEAKVIFRAEAKRDLAKNRAESLRLYYINTFSDDDTEKIQKGSGYNPDNFFIRSVRYLLR